MPPGERQKLRGRAETLGLAGDAPLLLLLEVPIGGGGLWVAGFGL